MHCQFKFMFVKDVFDPGKYAENLSVSINALCGTLIITYKFLSIEETIYMDQRRAFPKAIGLIFVCYV